MAARITALSLGLLLTVLLAALVPGTQAQEPGQWLIGTWNGAHQNSRMTILKDASRFVFSRDGDIIRWSMIRDSETRGLNGHMEAEGAVTKLSDSAVELTGRYTARSSLNEFVGRELVYKLRRSGNVLEGETFGGSNAGIFSLRMTKAE